MFFFLNKGFSNCLMLRFNNERFCRHEFFNKINSLILKVDRTVNSNLKCNNNFCIS